MTFVTFATWIVVAIVTAWGVGTGMKYGGRGRTSDILLGLAGSGTASVIVWSFGVFPEPGMAAAAVVAAAGAGAAIALQRKFFYVPLGTVRTPR